MIPIAGLMMMTTSASNLEFPDIPKMIGDKYKETREKITKDSLFKQKKNIMELINKEKEIYTNALKNKENITKAIKKYEENIKKLRDKIKEIDEQLKNIK
jgi:hypothetical protein